ncbi:amino acid adenylation domain-containing protein [Robbsia sp. Bb-Pol-6]|uniref:Amino acid adenylation domain-containing protein n=1 Tax=Robbsia betulipollinis TaxID=2981849 RepID=A0ABT3ZKV1_9BURK|nr:amino acid adenylation domain-containing protein [Robbsia betulipollinis]MCY0386570.1 amino acid adenylation domain-containing protein [Robbsia betulipollinis]
MFVDAYFFNSFLANPSAPALWVDSITYSYADLAQRALAVSRQLQAALTARRGVVAPSAGDIAAPRACLLFALRSVNAYAGLLGALHAGYGYIPLSPHSPDERNLQVIRSSGSRIVLVDGKWKEDWDSLAAKAPEGFLDDFLIVHVDVEHLSEVLSAAGLREAACADARRDPGDLAYILFTSGSTGTPKGVKISHTSIASYIGNESMLRPRAAGDRYSQFFDLTTDPSVEETFLCWANGACLYTMPKNDPLSVSAFLIEHQLTHFSSVPSTIAFLKQYRKLKPGMFPHLKLSIFGGEAFRGELLRSWAEAAPNAEIRNMYGPTETTVAVAKFAIAAADVDDRFEGVLPIGKAMAGVELVIVDENGEPVPSGEPGELLIGGPQLAIGYIGASADDMQRFVAMTFAGKKATRWYRTGDLVCTSRETAQSLRVDAGDDLQYRFLGRIDSQVKIRGNRIELQEVESVLAAASGAAMTAAIALPADALGVSLGIIGFVSAPSQFDADDHGAIAAWNATVLQGCRARLPAFAVPIQVVHLDEFPLNLAGKLDRLALTRQYLHANERKAR